MNDQLQTQIAEVLKALKDGAVEYGPQALDMALTLKRVEGAQAVLIGLAGLILLALTVRHFRRQSARPPQTPQTLARIEELTAKGYTRRLSREDRELERLTGNVDWMDHPEWVFYLFPLMFGAFMVTELFDIWNWTALFRPDIALARDVLLKLTGN